MSFALRPLDLMELIDETVKADEGFAARHNLRLQVVAAQPGAKVHADPDRLAQVMTNLISSSPRQEVRWTLQSRARADG